jgi:cell division protein FtsL
MQTEKRKYYLPFLLIALVISWLFFWLHEPSYPVIPETDSLKKEIKQDLGKRDSVKKEVIKTDSVRVKEIIRWRKLKADTVYLPCDSLIKKIIHVCDTIIQVDSTEIAQMKHIVKLDSLIISDQYALIIQDSIQINGLKKEVKKQKRLTKIMAALAVVLAGVGLAK